MTPVNNRLQSRVNGPKLDYVYKNLLRAPNKILRVNGVTGVSGANVEMLKGMTSILIEGSWTASMDMNLYLKVELLRQVKK